MKIATGSAIGAATLVWAAPAAAQTEILTPFQAISTARARLKEYIEGSDGAVERIVETLSRTSPTGDPWWHLEIALWSVGGLLVGYLVSLWLQKRIRERMAYLYVPDPRTRYDKLTYLLLRAAIMMVSVAATLLVAAGIALGVNGGEKAAQIAHGLHIGGVGVVMVLHRLSLNLLAPDVPSHRLVTLPDELALGLHRGFVGAIAIAAAIFLTCLWMALLGLDHNVHMLILATGLVAIALVFVGSVVWARPGIHALISQGRDDLDLPKWRRFLAHNAFVLVAIYFAAALFVAEVRILSNQPLPFGPILVPLFMPVAAGYLYLVMLLIIDGVSRRAEQRAAERDEGDILDGGEEPVGQGPGQELAYEGAGLKDVAEDAAALLVLGFVAYWLFRVWSLSPTALGYLWQFFDIIAVAFLGFVAYKAIKAVIDRRMWEEGDQFEAAEPGDEGSAKSATRLATLLPLIRNFLLITIVVMTVMIIAFELGVNIAPLFAGAGVVGLAVGFGAQTLIADIFSGAFFLIDDAFRKGDYVETGGVRGTVEKISVRSMQLRHHLGPLHTIPFSQIAHLTNYSRDWAMMKLKLRLTYDTDVEKVRKLIKNLGKELQADPEIGDKFVQPLKSQGVYAMEDSAMIIRVKFMTRPGEQFVIRKRVYADIRKLFEDNGIKFAHREVTVRLAPDERANGLTDDQKESIAGSVLPVIDNDGENAKQSEDGR